ncbi:MAG: S9 family peptidase [Bacteroidales bacterium]|jgi:dipeptidyl aminopeptidase/acylaminoacyl peptidase
MKNKLSLLTLLVVVITVSCKQKQPEPAVKQNDFSVALTDQEKAGGVMTPEIMWKFSRLGGFALSPDGSTVIYSTTKYDLLTENRVTNIFKIPSTGGEAVQLTADGGSSPQWINGGKKIIFLKKGSLWTMNTDGSEQKAVTGLSEFEIFNVSPAGDKIYFTRRVKLDQTANEKYNLPKAKVRIINDLMYRHWNYWSDYSYSHLFVASFDGQNVTGEKDVMKDQRFESPLAPYFEDGEISWSHDGKYIAYTTKRLSGKADAVSTNSDIYLYEVSTGKEVNISEGNMGYDRAPVFSPDGSMIAYQSMQRDGYEADLDRLFIYNIKDGKREWLTKSWDFDVESIVWADNNTLYFTCDQFGTKQIFKTDLNSRNVSKLTEGTHNLGPINLSSPVMIAQITSMSMAPEICSVNVSTGSVKKITQINKYIYDFIKMGKVEEKHTRTKDNQNLQMWVVFPPDFDPSKKYPALLFCEGGPQSALDQFWSYRWNLQMMAAKGYIVYAPNRRGVVGFGQQWKEEISGDWGGKNIQDYLDATDAMAKEPYVDKDRMGAVGASYGGTSVYVLAGVHQKRFKAFISHAGVFDLISEYGSTEELWFPNFDCGGPYWMNNQSLKYSSHLMVDKWDTPILIITGANDFRIPYTQSLEAFTAARMRGIPARLLFFEDENHWVTKPENSVIWQHEFFEWLDTYLKK